MGQKTSRQLPRVVSKPLYTAHASKAPLGPRARDHLEGGIKAKVTSDRQQNNNVNRMARIRVEEVPQALDESHPAMTTLRNRQHLDSLLKAEVQTTVTPGAFVNIVDDLDHYSLEEVQRRYGLSDDSVRMLGNAKISIARERMEVAEEEEGGKKEKEEGVDADVGLAREEEKILNRESEGSDLESALDSLMRK